MANWYANINDSYTAPLSNGTENNPFDCERLQLFVEGNVVNGSTAINLDTINMRGRCTQYRGSDIFANYALSFYIRAWDERTPWFLGSPYGYIRIRSDNGAAGYYTLRFYDGVFEGVSSQQYQVKQMTLFFYNCTIYFFSISASGGQLQYINLYGCTLANKNGAAWNFGAGGGANIFLALRCVLEDVAFVATAAWGFVDVYDSILNNSQAVSGGGLAPFVTYTVTGSTFSYDMASSYPAFADFTQELVRYALYELPYPEPYPADWTTYGLLIGWWGYTRYGEGAFWFANEIEVTASPDHGNAALKVDFSAEITHGDGEPVAWDWTFGDGDTGSGPTPSHIYDMPGEYTACVTATFLDGTTDTSCTTIYVYDYEYSGTVPNASLTDKCYRLPVRGGEGFGVSEYKDSSNPGLDWIWPPANIQIGKGYDIQKREVILVLNSKNQREYQINDFDVWLDRDGPYGGNIIKSEIHHKAHFAEEGEHVPIRHVEHHLGIKSFDRKKMQGIVGYDSVGLPLGFRVDNELYQDEEPFTPVVTTKRIPEDGDIVFQEKVEGRNLQLRSIFYGAPYLHTTLIPYYEAVNKQQKQSLRRMTEDSYQNQLASLPLFHVSRNYNPILNLATGESALGTYTAAVTGPDGKLFSAFSLNGIADIIYDVLPENVAGNFTMYMWINNVIPAAMPIQIFALQNLSVDIQNMAGAYELQVNHNGQLFNEAIEFNGTAWALITIIRDGLQIKMYENKNYLGTHAILNAVGQGNGAWVGNGALVYVFDPCLVPRAVTLEAIEYYYDDVIRGGNEVLQPF